MKPKDLIEAVIASLFMTVYCVLVVLGKISAEGMAPIVMYVVKKYFDGVEEERSKE